MPHKNKHTCSLICGLSAFGYSVVWMNLVSIMMAWFVLFFSVIIKLNREPTWNALCFWFVEQCLVQTVCWMWRYKCLVALFHFTYSLALRSLHILFGNVLLCVVCSVWATAWLCVYRGTTKHITVKKREKKKHDDNDENQTRGDGEPFATVRYFSIKAPDMHTHRLILP